MMEQCKENETMRNYKITVAGTGYVGLSIATLLSQHHQVTAVDIVPEKVELINNRKSPMCTSWVQKALERMVVMKHSFISSRSITRIKKTSNIMLPVKLMVTAVYSES